MSERSFVHLHCHSHYSLLDGAAPIGGLVEQAKHLGMNALALTDHGNLHGAVEFYQEAKKAGINPVLGYEAYIAPGSRFERDAGSMREASYHLTLLAMNRTGFKNLIRLSSAAFLEGFYFKPRIDREILEAYNEGIICLSGCVSSEFNRTILRTGDDTAERKEAEEIAHWFHRVFGDRYYIEIQNNGLEIQRIAMEGAVDIARKQGLPVVATSDAHYIKQEDSEAQDILLCINTGKYRTDKDRLKMENDQFYLRSPMEMYLAFPGLEDAVQRSQEIADRIDIDLDLGRRHFPVYALPENETPEKYLRSLCLQGLEQRYQDIPDRWQDGALASEVLDRLDRELHVIHKLGFANYFLMVWDFVRYARQNEIPCTARGSGVGSLVCYALYMSHVCPIRYDLLFERFLDENRLESPDIDIDFCKQRRGEVIQYVKQKYGEKNVAQIGTFGTLAARAAIRDVGRAMSLSIPRVDQIVAMVPDILRITLREALDKSQELNSAYEADGEVRELLDLAMKIEGLARNVGTHAAAVVIADQPLTEYVPLGRVQGKNDIITQWAMKEVEAAGLLKMDFLGLRNLTILSECQNLIEQTTGEKIDPHEFPLDDADTFALLCRGETKGIFQLESGGIRDLLQKMKPDDFRDIIATNALYRPGPLEGGMVDDYVAIKHGQKSASYPHPDVQDILEETHGVMVYQEQVMRLLNRLGNISLSDAYTCIKAISKKTLQTIAKFQEQFIDGATAKGLARQEALDLFGLIEKFAGYGFNKSHSTAYALIAYQTAYLKAHYPIEFMAALLTGDIPGRNFKSKDSLVEHLEDCRRMNITVVPPDVNHSAVVFRVEHSSTNEKRIHFALSAIKGCGGGAGDAIVSEHQKGGLFRSLFDFCERIDSRSVNRSTIETLIKAGAFDSLGARRSQLAAVIERAMQSGASVMDDRRRGQANLFEELEEPQANDKDEIGLPDIPNWDEREQLSGEKEVLGYYLSSHPLEEYSTLLAEYCSNTTNDLRKMEHRSDVVLGGMLSAVRFSHTKNPRRGQTETKYAMFDLEDLQGIIRCILWPDAYVHCGQLVEVDSMLLVQGTVDRRPGSEEVNVIVSDLIPLTEASQRFTSRVRIQVNESQESLMQLESLHEILRHYPGECTLELMLCLENGMQVRCNCEDMRIENSKEMRSRVQDLLGPNHLRATASLPNRSHQNTNRRRQPPVASH